MCSVDLKGVDAVFDLKWSHQVIAALASVGKQHASLWTYEGNRLAHIPMRFALVLQSKFSK